MWPILCFSLIFAFTSAADYSLFGQYALDKLRTDFDEVLVDMEDSQCLRDVKKFVRDLGDGKSWALKMLDASGKIPSGIMIGNMDTAGSYDSCLEIQEDTIKGKYCINKLLPSEVYGKELGYLKDVKGFMRSMGYMSERWDKTDAYSYLVLFLGICVPSSCNRETLQEIYNRTEDKFQLKVHLEFVEQGCRTSEMEKLSIKAIFGILFFVVVAVVLLVATFYDFCVKDEIKRERWRVLLAFSMHQNIKRLFKTSKDDSNMAFLDGVKVLSLAWVVLGHTFQVNITVPHTNGAYIFEWTKRTLSAYVEASTMAVDSFFTVSGLLLVYVYLSKDLKISALTLYAYRFLRLMPALLAIVIFYSCVMYYTGDGPYWYVWRKQLLSACDDYWWTTLLFVQNYWNPNAMCPNHSWFIAVDTHLYMLSPILFRYVSRFPRRFLLGTSISVVVSIVIAFVLTIVFDVGAIPMDVGSKYYQYMYNPTHMRCAPWLIGTIWGYVLFKTRDSKSILSKKIVVLSWTLSISSMLVIILSHTVLAQVPFNILSSAIFNAFSRPVWALALGWIIFACHKGYGGPVNSFLSMPIFAILSRMNYSVYLVHLPLIHWMVYRRRDATHFDDVSLLIQFFGYYAFSLVVGVIWTLAFESPITVLQKILFKRDAAKTQQILTEIGVDPKGKSQSSVSAQSAKNL